jgi:hypothetical protein
LIITHLIIDRKGGAVMTTSFQGDILPLFTEVDIEHMGGFGVVLNDYAYMSQPDNAAKVYEQVSQGLMPPAPSEGGEGAWSPDKVELFKAWIDDGYQP